MLKDIIVGQEVYTVVQGVSAKRIVTGIFTSSNGIEFYTDTNGFNTQQIISVPVDAVEELAYLDSKNVRAISVTKGPLQTLLYDWADQLATEIGELA